MAVPQDALISGGRALVGATAVGYKWLGSYGNPARGRALRFIEAFAAHEISSNQIADLDHPCRRLSAAQLGDTAELMKVLEPEHLDWASDLLWVNRAWLSSGEGQPHREHDYNTSQVARSDLPSLVAWLEDRMAAAGRGGCRIRAFSTAQRVPDDRGCSVTAVLEEDFAPEGAGGRGRFGSQDKRRYVLLANNWGMDDRRGLVGLATIFAAAMRVRMAVVGNIVKESQLSNCEQGKSFISGFKPRGPMLPYIAGRSVGFKRLGYIPGVFEGEYLVTGHGYQRAPWYDQFRGDLQQRLKDSGDDRLLQVMQPFR